MNLPLEHNLEHNLDRRHLPLNFPLEHSLDRLPNYLSATRAVTDSQRTTPNAGRIDLRPYHRTAIRLLLHQIRHCLTTILTLTPAAWASDHTSALLVACICSL